MTEGETNISDQQETRRSLWLTLFTVVLLAIVFGGIFFVTQKRSDSDRNSDEQMASDGEEAGGKREDEKKTLLELATAPENSPDFKPNPELTALVTAPRDPSRREVSKINVNDLTAPSAEN